MSSTSGLLIAVAAFFCSSAQALEYPTKTVKIIVPFGPGGASDTLPRVVGQRLQELWGQTVIVENRPGAAGNIGMEIGSRAEPDGHTLIAAPVGNIAMNPHLYPNLKFDIFKSFTPVTLIGSVENVLVVNSSVQATTVNELLALAKAKPGELNYGSGGVGTQAHIGMELLASHAGVKMLHVPYKGVGESLSALVGGQVNMILAQIPAVMPFIQAGKVRPLAVASANRNPLLPNVPTVNEAANLKGFEAISWYAFLCPEGTSEEVVSKIQKDVSKVLAMPDIAEKFRTMGVEPVGSTSRELASRMRADHDKYGEIIKKASIKVE